MVFSYEYAIDCVGFWDSFKLSGAGSVCDDGDGEPDGVDSVCSGDFDRDLRVAGAKRIEAEACDAWRSNLRAAGISGSAGAFDAPLDER